ncbi:LysM peptidoglycan-binding domain-containing protein [Paenibacillus sp. NEAU-GSW1]|uniref:LysM peptidoglycan-binding domain-containing protein n=1 Tax=Paenibacillus sp. NEAU-GSW1 TaxID=2682486 RepID=UPI0012E27B47|nr:LysM peptidoglycan-binding domain-containing protein [Paenibacillus sp. NEAU-GSW1]MUT68710.1 LysM domain-containing protein [Paenibacillus sp. NEAU-GSW1]
MQRGFTPFGGGGFRPPFRPVPHPFFPRRFFFPFFFFSPFIFPFFPFREGAEDATRNDHYFAHHQSQAGETMAHISHMYNIPCAFLEEANPELTAHAALQPGTSVYIPRISHMQCHKTYVEREVEAQAAAAPHQAGHYKG